MIESNLRVPQRQQLFMNFIDVEVPNGRPSDIDMFYCGKNYIVLGEIKNEKNTESFEKQRFLYEKLLDNSKYKYGVIMLITHNKSIENKDEQVNIGKEGIVEEYKLKGNVWCKPREVLSVNDFLEKCFYADEYTLLGWERK